MLTAENLYGVWALVPTPWTSDDRLDIDTFREDVAYLCQTGVHGLYITASSGEFYALDFPEFCLLVDIFLEEVKKAQVPHQVGCGWSDTRGALRRAEYAASLGATAIQIVFPYYSPLTRDEGLAFLEEVSRAAGSTPLIHYNTAHAGLILGSDDYRVAKDRVPNLIGTKITQNDALQFTNYCEQVPGLSHFTGEYSFVANFAGGARGLYSWMAITNPSLTLEWYDACYGGDWERAIQLQKLVNLYKIHVKMKWRGQGDAAVNKADAALNPHIKCPLRVRGPYTSCEAADLERARKWAEANFPELIMRSVRA